MNGAVAGFLMSLPYLTSCATIPLLNRFMLMIGVENTILYSNFAYAGGMIISGSALTSDNKNVFLPFLFVGQFL